MNNVEMEYTRKYNISTWYSEEDKCYLAMEDNLKITCHGNSTSDAIKELFIAMSIAENIEDSSMLKPCPFCGSEAEIVKGDTQYKPWAVLCQNGELTCNVRLLYCDDKKQAIQQWNVRV